jgi:hypothetical protein
MNVIKKKKLYWNKYKESSSKGIGEGNVGRGLSRD